MKHRHLIWRKSPLPILLFLLVLLLALGHFEAVSRRIRNLDLVIEILPEAGFAVVNADQYDTVETEQFPQSESDDFSIWYDRIAAEPPAQIRPQWDAYKGDVPFPELESDVQYFEIRLLLAEGEYSAADQLISRIEPSPADEQTHLLLKAIIQNRMGRRASAISIYQQLIEASPNSFIAHFNLGIVYHNLNRYTLAAEELQKAVDLAGNAGRSKAYRALGQALVKLGNIDEAQSAFEESILLEPAVISSRLALAELFFIHRDDLQSAREVFDEVRRLNPALPDLYLGLAELEIHEDNLDRAVRVLEDARPLVPDSLPIDLMIARLMIDDGQMDKAISILKDLQSNHPEDSGVAFQLGRAHYKTRDYHRAETDFNQAIRYSQSPPTEALNNLGLVYTAQQRWEDAEKIFLDAINLNPWYETAHYNLGLVYINLEQYIMAEASFLRVLEIDREYQPTWYNLGIVYGEIGEINKAINAYSQSLLLLPDDPKARLNLAVQYRKLGDLDRAEEQYSLVLEINPKYAPGWFNLGVLQKLKEEYSKAEISYRKALELDPEETAYWLNLSALLSGQNRTQEAIIVLKDAIDAHSESVELRYNLALQYKKIDRIDLMVDEITIALKLDPAYVNAWKLLGDMYSDQGNHEEALSSYLKVVQFDPDDSYSRYLLGKEQYSLDDFEAAVESFEAALADITDNSYIWYNAGRAHLAIGQSRQAQEYYHQALDLNPGLADSITEELELVDDSGNLYKQRMNEDPNNPDWPIQLAILLQSQGDDGQAISVLEDAFDRIPGNSEVQRALAGLYLEMGQEEAALDLYEQIIVENPDRVDSYLSIGEVLVKTENWESAETYLNRGLEIDETNPKLLKLLGEAYFRQEKYPESVVTLER
ncbi:MAG: tetratricopeptide repeat protein, partial [Spirochaetaceae bacterium]|nr:tetratricopeptide repeat protein [Spirochaetaceae bacterium]